jgi:hypothetical protein
MASYKEFESRQRAEHSSPFIRWSAVVAWYVLALPAVAMAGLGRRKAGAVLFALSQVAIAAGHVVEGNLLDQSRITVRHPIWVLRADIAIANDTVMDLVRKRGTSLG